MKFEFTKSPSQKEIETLTQKINLETAEFGSAYPFAFFIRDNHGTMISGVNGYVIYGTIYTDQLWVDPNYRKQGFARQLMNKVHEFGCDEGCKIATVQTMSFQGTADFYEKLGYKKDFERSGYANGSACLFLKKDIFRK